MPRPEKLWVLLVLHRDREDGELTCRMVGAGENRDEFFRVYYSTAMLNVKAPLCIATWSIIEGVKIMGGTPGFMDMEGELDDSEKLGPSLESAVEAALCRVYTMQDNCLVARKLPS